MFLRHGHAIHLLASGVHPKVATGMQEDATAKVDAALKAAKLGRCKEGSVWLLANRPIDIKRDSAGSFEIPGPPGEKIVDMIVINGRLTIVGYKGIYQAQTADSLDPSRLDITLPKMIQRMIVAYGCETPFVARTLMTARSLFDKAYLGQNFEVEKALALGFEAARELAAMQDLVNDLASQIDSIVAQGAIRPKGDSLHVPTVANLSSRVGNVLGHARRSVLIQTEIAGLFYPKAKSNDTWTLSVLDGLRKDVHKRGLPDSEIVSWFDGLSRLVDTVLNLRNANIHPDAEKRLVISDFEILPGTGRIDVPSIELKHPDQPLQRSPLMAVMRNLIDHCSGSFEDLCATLCNLNIDTPPFIQARVTELPPNSLRNGVRFVYKAVVHGLPPDRPVANG